MTFDSAPVFRVLDGADSTLARICDKAASVEQILKQMLKRCDCRLFRQEYKQPIRLKRGQPNRNTIQSCLMIL